MPHITAIIVNYNAGEMLLESARSILRETCVCKIIIIDNNSKDNSMEAIERLAEAEPRIICIRNSENLGFAKACNMAIPMVQSSYMLFFNPDCVAEPDSLEIMMKYMESAPGVAMAGPYLLNPDGSEQAGGRRIIPTPWRSVVRIFGMLSLSKRYPHLFSDFLLHQQPLPDGPVEIEAISGSCMLVRHDALLDVGPMDESYFMHCEDLDWCMRFRQRRWKVMFVPEARVVHHKGACSKTRPVFVEWHKHKGMVLFYRKFFRHQYPLALMWIVSSGVWLRFCLFAAYHTARLVGRKLVIGDDVADNSILLTPASLPEENGFQSNQVGIIGATSLVGDCLLPLLKQAGWRIVAYSRGNKAGQVADGVEWQKLPTPLLSSLPRVDRGLSHWICAAPIWVLPEYFTLLEAHGVQRVVALSSTSRFTKNDSSDPEEQAMAHRFSEAEACVQVWAENRGVEWVILRPTLIYDFKRDKNISEIARFIRRFGFFPLLGKAGGLRQPIHAQDVAGACMTALQAKGAANRAYNISGGETLPYCEMVSRVFAALCCRPRFLHVPLSAFSIAVALLRRLPRYRQWSVTMAERMNRDLVFDHSDATRDLAFDPREFVLLAEDAKLLSEGIQIVERG